MLYGRHLTTTRDEDIKNGWTSHFPAPPQLAPAFTIPTLATRRHHHPLGARDGLRPD